MVAAVTNTISGGVHVESEAEADVCMPRKPSTATASVTHKKAWH